MCEERTQCIYCGEDATGSETAYCTSCESELMKIWEKERRQEESRYRRDRL